MDISIIECHRIHGTDYSICTLDLCLYIQNEFYRAIMTVINMFVATGQYITIIELDTIQTVLSLVNLNGAVSIRWNYNDQLYFLLGAIWGQTLRLDFYLCHILRLC